MNITVRQEQSKDFSPVFNLIKSAFKNKEYSDHSEHLLVEKLRGSEAFIPELSLVAEFDAKIVGHILLTKIKVRNKEQEFESLALAPVSVLPEFQGKGIGRELIINAHQIAKKLGYESIILLGHSEYYPRFGYRQLDKFGISLPFEVPKENCMVVELTEGALEKVNGVVEYPKEFF
ncbi:MAG: N-acetyltransferase [Balneolaceae bacterium]|nr:N-acetyltransferase [Balneolaceae bacterium]MBO6544922.1 N-acetyltransferase [Balneolaceae bacterium]MBO6646318.1 N-acetyltransferase [Balneolaceae bacterium]